MTKRFDLDVGKRRARRRFQQFIKTRIYDRKEVQILCFPGEQGFEIEQVYRPLGFKDENIWGIERDKKAAATIEQRYPNINVYHGDMKDFVAEYEGLPFGIVSLDYCGHFGDDKMWPLVLLLARGLIAKRSCIAMNVMAGREDADAQSTMRGLHAAARNVVYNGPMDAVTALEVLSETAKEDLADVRSDAVTQALTSTLSYLIPSLKVMSDRDLAPQGCSYALGLDSKVTYKPNGEMVLSNVRKVEHRPHSVQSARAVKHQAIQDVNKELKDLGIIEAAKRDARYNGIPEAFFDYHLGRTLVMSWYDQEGEPNFPVGLERISYISDSGKRMVSDFIETRRFDMSYINKGVGCFESKDKPDEHQFGLSPAPTTFGSGREYLDYLKKIVLQYSKIVEKVVLAEHEFWPKREDLGGGESIPVDLDKLKQKVVELVKKGKTTEEIAEKVRFLSVGTIRAIRAHTTMGSYEKGKVRRNSLAYL